MDPCAAFEEKLFWLQQGELEADLVPEVEAHRAECAPCQAAFEAFAGSGPLLDQLPGPPAWKQGEVLRWSSQFRERLLAVEAPPAVAKPRRSRSFPFLLQVAAVVFMSLGTAFGVAWERASWPTAERGRAVTAYLQLADHHYLDLKSFDEAYVYYGLALELQAYAQPGAGPALENAQRRLNLIDDSQDHYELLRLLADGERLMASEPERSKALFAEVMADAPDQPAAWLAVELYSRLLVSEAEAAVARSAPKPDVDALKAELRELFPRREPDGIELEKRLEKLRALRSLSNHSVAAHAQLTIAELLRRAGRQEDAIESYTVVIKEYGDVDSAVDLARRRLAEPWH